MPTFIFFSSTTLETKRKKFDTTFNVLCRRDFDSTRKIEQRKNERKERCAKSQKFFSSTRKCFLSSLYNANFLIKSALLFGLHRKQPIHKTLSDCQFSLYPEATKTFIIVLAKNSPHKLWPDSSKTADPTEKLFKNGRFFWWKEPKQENKYH